MLSYEQGQFLTDKHLSLNQSTNVYFVRDLHSLFFLVQNKVFPEEEKKNQIKPKFQKFLFILNYSLVVITSFMLSHICSLNLTSFSTTIHLLNQKKKPTTITRSLSPKTLGSIMNFQQIKKELVEIYSFLSFYYI